MGHSVRIVVCVYLMRNFMELERVGADSARGVGAARERRDERCDDDDEGGRDEDDEVVEVDVDGWIRVR